ncbi:MAG: RNA methyltransferase [Synergistaceae bacterium]|jgi:23S rRNA (guanosine2251-2'-O)-methyltransferase|nr:RNA methyltransferase [Synergistaceae bacterium]
MDELRQPDVKISDEGYCWGKTPVIYLLKNAPSRCMKVLISREMRDASFVKITKLCRLAQIPFTRVERKVLDAAADGENHQGVVISVSVVPMLNLAEALGLLPETPMSAMAVLMDHVEDPRNAGAMIRSAEAAGAVFAAMPSRRNALPAGTVAKTSAGASLRLPLASVINVANAVRDAQEAGLWTIGLAEDAGRSIYDSPLPPRSLFVIGGEKDGLSRTTRSACDELLRIPMASGGAENLNAAVALSVCMFEWLRVNRMSDMWSEKNER